MTRSWIVVWLSRTLADLRRWAVGPIILCLAPAVWMLFLPGLASAQSDGVQGTLPVIQGTVKDASGSAVTGAIVTLETAASAGGRTAITDRAGGFRFLAVEPGNYKITIGSPGFAVWTAANVEVGPGDDPLLLSPVLQVATASSSVNVTPPVHELAAEQLKAEEKQRLLGVFPAFFVSYAPNPAPLTAAQKFQLGWKTITDPVSFLDTGLAAAIQQFRKNYPEFGQGTEGYAKRFGALYAGRVSNIVIGHVVMQSIFHQDPRYYSAKEPAASVRERSTPSEPRSSARVITGTGSPIIRTFWAVWQLARFPRCIIHPASRPGRRLVDGVMLGFAGRAASNLSFVSLFSGR